MSNWVVNKITFNGTNESIEKLRGLILKPDEENGMIEVDFSILIPEPEFAESEPISPNDEFKMPDWYIWRCDNWGTKWNACNSGFNESDNKLEIYFKTAWACPEFWLLKVIDICKGLGIDITGIFADEDDGGDNWGIFTNDGFKTQNESDKRQIYMDCWGIDIEMINYE